MTYSAAERETIGLCICLEAVSDIVNHSLLTFRDVSAYPGEAEAIFPSRVHRDLFLIRLLDFVKETGSKQLTGVAGSCLAVLKQACASQCFNINGSIAELQSSVDALEAWLSEMKEITLWLPTLEINAKIKISRLEFLNITGNHSKHNLSRLTGVSRDVAKMLAEHGYCVSEDQIPLALDDFREHLAENYFVYYSTWLSELLNNIRWGLQSYLTPIFFMSYKTDPADVPMYTYEYPTEITESVAREWFWRLMNNVRSRPYFKKFSGAHYLKKESSLEWQDE
ncbi:hypothetical protein [Pseudomonas rhizophila]